MIRTFDLADIAGTIDGPYRPVPLVALGPVQVSVAIFEGPKSWRRAAEHDELMLVLEGVITVEGADGVLVVHEGELVRVPARALLDYNSGMRSTVLEVGEMREPDESGDGLLDPAAAPSGPLGKTNVGVRVMHAEPFYWESAGETGGFTAHATRLVGRSAPYRAAGGAVAAIVYRGVMDFATPDTSGAIVGSQMLVVPEGTEVTLGSERGATVVLLVRGGSPPPSPAGRATD